MERFWRIGRERAETMADLLEVAQLEAVVQSLELIRQTGEEIWRTSGPPKSTG